MDDFTTPRLTAERLHERHLEDLVALHLDAEVSRFLGGVRSAEATQAYLDTNLDHWARHGFGLWALKSRDGTFIGRAGIRPLVVEGVVEIEVAYALARAFWGHGLASEITEGLVAQGLTRRSLSSLVGVVAADNIASRRVLEKSGFAVERTVVHAGAPHLLYRRRRAELSGVMPAADV